MINNVSANYNNQITYEKRQQRIKLAVENKTARISTIADEGKRGLATEIQNRILHGGYGKEQMTELSEELRGILAEHGDTQLWMSSLIGMSMKANVGTDDEPIWAVLRGGNIWVHTGDLDGFLSNETRAQGWVNPFVKLEEAAGLDETIASRLLQYQSFLNLVNDNKPVSWNLFDNLRDATSFFGNNPITPNADAFRSFTDWLFNTRAVNPQETATASQLANNFVNLFFAQLAENSDAEQSFLTAWSGIQPPHDSLNWWA